MEQPAYVVEGIQKCEEVRREVELGMAQEREKEAQRQIKKQKRQVTSIGRK